MSMDKEQKIQLTVIQPSDGNDELEIDLRKIFEGLRRFLAVWLAVAIAIGAIGAGVGIALRSMNDGAATALIRYTLEEDEDGNVPTVDISKLKAPAMVEPVMTELGLDNKDLDEVRSNITITGVMDDETYEQVTLYNNLLNKNSVNAETVRNVIDMDVSATRFIVSFDYKELEYDRETGVRLLNGVIENYREYFDGLYNGNNLLGSAIETEQAYDYVEELEILEAALDDVKAYCEEAIGLNEEEKEDEEEKGPSAKSLFRSRETGYTFEDLLEEEELIRTIDYERVKSFVDVNSVTSKDAETEISHYQYLIEELERQRDVAKAKVDSLSSAIKNYEKDPVLYATDASGSLTKQGTTTKTENEEESLDAYDTMVQNEIEAQKQVVEYNSQIRYYESVIEKLQKSDRVIEANQETASEYMAELLAKVSALVSSVNATVKEFNERAVKENNLWVLVPASAKKAGITDGGWMKKLLVAEVLVFLGYCCAALVYGIKASGKRKEETVVVAQEETAAAVKEEPANMPE